MTKTRNLICKQTFHKSELSSQKRPDTVSMFNLEETFTQKKNM